MPASTDGSFGSPSTRSPMMLCCTSSVPPAIDAPGTDTSTSATMPRSGASPPASMPWAPAIVLWAAAASGRSGCRRACRSSPRGRAVVRRAAPPRRGRRSTGPCARWRRGERRAGERAGHRQGRGRGPAPGRDRLARRAGGTTRRSSGRRSPRPAPRSGCGPRRSTGWTRTARSRGRARAPAWSARPPSPRAASPTTWSTGTRAPDKNTSLNDAQPFICRSGRTSTPGWRIGKAKNVMPLCLGTSGSVRASSMP